ncbi:hypothetical protein C8A03DRAFT_44240 [Achaetomium macrosporum]|uniref:HD domain-containing protein n=1 Tax=Achaetomium macrosporum TaxID=79813 RepID=A0AAN7C9N2_9PEZI|nr:hypothetical protein C8A03DRAFT_44240 [Achaetomium macrosporum]
MFFISLVYLFLSATWLPLLTHATPRPKPSPRRVIAGVSVVDTPIVRAAQQFARDHSDDRLYNHVMRAWLFGTLLLDHNETLRASVDEEIQAVGLMLHDLGANHSLDSPFVTLDRRFEVDGAFAARSFIRSHPDGRHWEERRVQLVWDGIALHAEPKFALFKEPDVVAIYWGNDLDFSGPAHGVTDAEYAAVVAEFPKSNQTDQVIEGITWHCRNKPLSTYDTFMQPYGEMFVPGYSAVGHRAIDRALGR